MAFDLLVANGTVVTADAVFRADIGVRDGKIAALIQTADDRRQTADGTADSPISDLQSPISRISLDARGCYVLPGAIDGHVHLHMPTRVGYTADDWRVGTQAAALGGVTALVDFVETKPGDRLVDALAQRVAEAKEAVIDYGLHMTIQPDEHPMGGVPRRVSAARLAQMREAYDAGCATFKLYMAYPGFQVQDGDLLRALLAVRDVGGLACIHAENGDVIDVLRATIDDGRRTTDDSHPSSVVRRPSSALWHARTRPSINEHEAATRAVMCAEVSGARILIFHIGCEHAARVVAEAKQRGLSNVFGETCPHYLLLTEDQLGS